MAASDIWEEDFGLPMSCVAFVERLVLVQPDRVETAKRAKLNAISADLSVSFMASVFI
jgi:hypothetical protein